LKPYQFIELYMVLGGIPFYWEGNVSFLAKSSLIDYYHKTLGAEVSVGQNMYIGEERAEKLISYYFKN
jgi:hypothetical protein